jgi:formylglycine-generating enzyme required for sulfatase activity
MKNAKITYWRTVYSLGLLSFTLYFLWALPIWANRPDLMSLASISPETITADCHRCHSGDRPTPLSSLQEQPCRQCHAPDEDDLLINQSDLALNSMTPDFDLGTASITDHTIQQAMILIPAGKFIMGNNGRGAVDGPGNPDETPSHQVFLEAFYIDQFETTNAMYQRFVEATGHRAPRHWRGNQYPVGKADHPVIYVDWFDADTFCQWAGKRLPTEQEWEKAARGTDGRIFPWGNTFSTVNANSPQYWLAKGVDEDSLGMKGDTLPVGSLEGGKSPYGADDMSGNVYEWTASWYLPYPGNSAWNMHYGHKNKVLRGGSWYDCLSYGCGLSAPTYNRSRFTPKIRNMSFGFRCAKNLE